LKKKRFKPQYVLLVLLVFLFASCEKESTNNEPLAKNKNREWVTGTWKAKDLVISVDVKIAGQKIPAGTSMIALAPLIGQALGNPAIAAAITCTKDNTYTFNADGTYAISGCTDLILPVAGNSGKWDLTVYDAVLELTSSQDKKDPHWINSITSNTINLSLTVKFPGLGAAPLGLILEKQP
jgi:hypothetical protein